MTTGLDPSSAFANFAQHEGCALALPCAKAWSSDPAPACRRLLIVGVTGSGKSHLLQAIGNDCEQRGLRVRYVRADEFVDQVVHHYQRKSFETLKAQFNEPDLLLLDDLQGLRGKDRSQEVLREAADALQARGARLALASDRPLFSLSNFDESLRSRLAMSATLTLRSSPANSMATVLEAAVGSWAYKPSRQIAEFLVQQAGSNLPSLLGAFHSVALAAAATGCEPGLSLVKRLLDAQGIGDEADQKSCPCSEGGRNASKR